MKSNTTFTISLLLCLIFTQKTNSQSVNRPVTYESINGAWELVWSNWNGQIKNLGKPLAFKMMNNGLESVLMQDSTGKWNQGAVCTLEIVGKSYREKVKYDTDPNFIGWQFWQTVEFVSDTLSFKLFTKVINEKGEDVSSQWPNNGEEKWIRVKK